MNLHNFDHIFFAFLKKALWNLPHLKFFLDKQAHQCVYYFIPYSMNKKIRLLSINKTKIG